MPHRFHVLTSGTDITHRFHFSLIIFDNAYLIHSTLAFRCAYPLSSQPLDQVMRAMQTFPHRVSSQFCAGMVSLHRTAKIGLMLCIDLIALPLYFLVAMLLRGGDLKLAAHYGSASYLIVALVTIGAFSMSDLYRAVIRFIDSRLLSATGLALGIAVLCAYVVLLAVNDAMFPRSALAIYWFIVFSYVVTSRIGMRNFLRNHGTRRPASDVVAICGAGESGARLAQTMRYSDEYRPVCFFDDKRALSDRTIAGLRVFQTGRLANLVAAHGLRTVVIAESMVKAIVSAITPSCRPVNLHRRRYPNPKSNRARYGSVSSTNSCPFASSGSIPFPPTHHLKLARNTCATNYNQPTCKVSRPSCATARRSSASSDSAMSVCP
jgi:hypothetical protein